MSLRVGVRYGEGSICQYDEDARLLSREPLMRLEPSSAYSNP